MNQIALLFRHLLALGDLFQCWARYRIVFFSQGRKAADLWAIPGFVRWAKRFLALYGLRHQCRGEENLQNIPWDSRHVFFLGNHQSYADIPSVLVAAGRPVGFMAKKELWRIPFLGFWMEKLGCVGVDRNKPSSAIRTLKDYEKRGLHKQLVLFPEGTRAKDGQLGEFKDGGLKLVWSLKAVIVPFVLDGTRQGFELRRSAFKKHQATVQLLPMQDLGQISKEMDFNSWKSSLEKQLEEQYQSLRASQQK